MLDTSKMVSSAEISPRRNIMAEAAPRCQSVANINVACSDAAGCVTRYVSRPHLSEHTPTMTEPGASTAVRSIRATLGMIARLSCCSVLLFLGAPRGGRTAEAPKGLADLSGFTDATLGVSQITADGMQCGLQPEGIGDTARHVIVGSGIALRDGADNRMTLSAVTTRVGPDQCATAVLLGAYAKESFFSGAAGWVQSGYVVLWQRSMIVATPVGQHAAAVLDATRRLSNQLLVDWRAQNSPTGPATTRSEITRGPSGSQVAVEGAPKSATATQ